MKILLVSILAIMTIGTIFSVSIYAQQDYDIPDWVKNTAGWWADDQIDDASFVNGIKFLIENDIMEIENQNAEIFDNSDNGDFILVYYETKYLDYEEWIKDTEYFENQVLFLNENFKLPYDIEIAISDCVDESGNDVSNAWWDHELNEIVICYALIVETDLKFTTYYDNVYPEWSEDEFYENVDYSLINIIESVFYHEVGHALVHVYDLPITGMEEDAVDQFSFYMSFAYPYEDDPENLIGQDTTIDIAIDYYLAAEDAKNSGYEYDETDYADTHSLNEQRFSNFACWVYGSNSTYNQYILNENWIPENRIDWCEWEYEQIMYSWEILLHQFLK